MMCNNNSKHLWSDIHTSNISLLGDGDCNGTQSERSGVYQWIKVHVIL